MEPLPSLANDDPARLLRPANPPAAEELPAGFGAVFGPAEYAITAKLPFVADLAAEERFDRLEELGFLSHGQAHFGTVDEDDPSQFTAYTESQITRFEGLEAAEDAFEVIEDESDVPDAGDTDAPRAFGSPAEITTIRAGDGQVTCKLTAVVADTPVNVSVPDRGTRPSWMRTS